MNIPGIRMELDDEIDTSRPTYKVKDLVAFLSSLDQETGVVWSGRDRHPLLLVKPSHGSLLFICESEKSREKME